MLWQGQGIFLLQKHFMCSQITIKISLRKEGGEQGGGGDLLEAFSSQGRNEHTRDKDLRVLRMTSLQTARKTPDPWQHSQKPALWFLQNVLGIPKKGFMDR